jgi:hypothetical protein
MRCVMTSHYITLHYKMRILPRRREGKRIQHTFPSTTCQNLTTLNLTCIGLSAELFKIACLKLFKNSYGQVENYIELCIY